MLLLSLLPLQTTLPGTCGLMGISNGGIAGSEGLGDAQSLPVSSGADIQTLLVGLSTLVFCALPSWAAWASEPQGLLLWREHWLSAVVGGKSSGEWTHADFWDLWIRISANWDLLSVCKPVILLLTLRQPVHPDLESCTENYWPLFSDPPPTAPPAQF